MNRPPYSLILLPTLECDADCTYCFEKKAEHRLSLERLSIVVQKILDHMERNHTRALSIYWQGGEVMTLPPEWFERANDLIENAVARKSCQVDNYFQSNMIAYSGKWNRVLAGMFRNSVGTSMDYPNLHRRLKGRGPGEFQRIWSRNVRRALDAGIQVGVISIPNEETLEMGAERFYSYFADELGIRDFQINTPFPGGFANNVKTSYPLDPQRLGIFLSDLANVWLERGFQRGVRLGPFSQLADYFVHGRKDFLCIWRDNCTDEFVCVDPRGWVAQCDCWVTSYPEHRFGNIFDPTSLSDLLQKSEARHRLLSRPGALMQKEDCLVCGYLSICHGGCPVRAYTVHGEHFRKDPYCELYSHLFQDMEKMASRLVGTR